MNEGNRRVFYDKTTGERIHEIGRNGNFTLPTIEQDIETFTVLSERNRGTFDVLELPFSTYVHDFEQSNSYQVNPETKELEFSYPDLNAPEAEPVFVKPLTEQVSELQNQLLSADEKFNLLDLEATPLEELAAVKIAQLSYLCTQAIYDGFATPHGSFGFNSHDQDNFEQQMIRFMSDSTLTEAKWKTKDNGVILLTKEQFFEVVGLAATHKLKHQEHYWNLEQAVIAATTNEEIKAIVW